jgi:hypothetical protein
MEPVQSEDRPVRTNSLLAASHLVASGFPILAVDVRADKHPVYVFSPAARDAIDAFYKARDGILAILPRGTNALVHGGAR